MSSFIPEKLGLKELINIPTTIICAQIFPHFIIILIYLHCMTSVASRGR
jgi:hypothetical protein